MFGLTPSQLDDAYDLMRRCCSSEGGPMTNIPRRTVREGSPIVHLAIGGKSRTMCDRPMSPDRGWGYTLSGRQVDCEGCLAALDGCFLAVVRGLVPMPPSVTSSEEPAGGGA